MGGCSKTHLAFWIAGKENYEGRGEEAVRATGVVDYCVDASFDYRMKVSFEYQMKVSFEYRMKVSFEYRWWNMSRR